MSRVTSLWAFLACCAGAAFLTCAAVGHAESDTPVAAPLTVIRAGTLIDGVNATTRTNQLIFVRGERIEKVADGAAAIPAGAKVIDLSNATVLPGLIDSHTHIFLWGEDPAKGGYDANILNAGIALRAARATYAVRRALEQGFTTIRDVETEGAGYGDIEIKQAIEEGTIPGPRIFGATLGISTTGGYNLEGYAPELEMPKGVQIVDGPVEARKAARQQLEHGADWIKVYMTHRSWVDKAGNLVSQPTLTVEELQAIVDEAHGWRKKVACHAYNGIGLQRALDGGCDSIEHGLEMTDAQIKQMQRQGTWYCPTLSPYYEDWAPADTPQGKRDRARAAVHEITFTKALQSNLKIVYGTDIGGMPWTVPMAGEFKRMVGLGMTPMAAIQSATSRAAEMLDMQGDIGAIAAGAYADVIAVAADPLKDVGELEHVAFVMHNGSVFKNDLARPMSTRRNFLSILAVPGLVLGAAPAVKALTRTAAFEPDPQADDAAVFATAREHFLITPGVAYCNTGTLGASPREVVDALTEGVRRLETGLADWPYEHPDGEPLTGYQPLLDVRAAVGQFVNAPAADIALTQNATMGMNFLANGLDLAAGDEVISTDQEHGGGISPWRLLAKRRGIVVKELPLEPAIRGRAGRDRAAVRVRDDAAHKGRDVQPHHERSRRTAAGARVVRACAQPRRARPRGRGTGGGPDPGGRAGARLRCLCRQPAQVDAGAERHRLPVRPARRAGSVLDDAGELPVGQPRRWRLSVHAVWNGKCSRGGRSDGGAALQREDRNVPDRAVGRKPHEASARRPDEYPGGTYRVTRRPAADRGHHDLSRQRREGQGAAGRTLGEARARPCAERRAGSPLVGSHVCQPGRCGRDPRRHP